jgi:hypothetical protein
MFVIKVSRDMERRRRFDVARNYFGDGGEGCRVEVVESDGGLSTRLSEKRPKTYCFANDDVVEWIRPHGPIVEASAGSGWLANRLQQLRSTLLLMILMLEKARIPQSFKDTMGLLNTLIHNVHS